VPRPLAAVAIAVLGVALAGSAFARPDGSYGSNCTGCHGGAAFPTPSTPTSFAASTSFQNFIRLTWSDPTPSKTIRYELFRSTGSIFPGGSPWRTIGPFTYPNGTANHGSDDATASPGVTYRYWVRSGNAGFVSGTATDTGRRPLPANLSCSPGSLSRTITAGSAAASTSFTCTNTGDGSLSYTISDNQSWLSVSPSSGSGSSHTVSFPGASGLAVGTYTGTISINGGSAGSDTVAVTLNVQAPPELSCPGQTLARTIVAGSVAPQQLFTCTNEGDGVVSYTVGDDQSWIVVAPTSAAGLGTDQSQVHTVTYPGSSALAPGVYGGTITINAGTAGTQTIAVTLTVLVPPAVGCSPESLVRTIYAGTPGVDLAFTCRNEGESALSYTITDDQNWLAVAPTSALRVGPNDPRSHTVSFPGAAALALGAYTGTISIGAGGAGTDTVTVTLQVVQPPVLSCSPGTLERTLYLGSGAASQGFTCSNEGAGSLSYTITDDRPWIGVGPTVVNGLGADATQTHTVSYPLAASLPLGVHTGTITVAAGTAGTDSVAVTFTVVQGAVLDCTDEIAVTRAEGQTTPAVLTCSNTGVGQSLGYTITEIPDTPWLGVAPPAQANVAPTQSRQHLLTPAATLKNGSYQTVLRVDAGSAGVVDVPVRFTIPEPGATLAGIAALIGLTLRARRRAACARAQ